MKLELNTRHLDVQDKKIAAISAGTLFTILFCILYFVGYRIPTPPLPAQLLYKDAEMELIPLEQIILDEGGGGGGSGTPVKAEQSDKFTPQTEQVLTQKSSSSSTVSGASNHTNSNTPNNNSATTTVKSENPFGKGGSGDGPDAGRGTGFGNDDGNSTGPSKGTGPGGDVKRRLISKPNTNSIQSDENCTIVLRVKIDASGDIIGTPTVDRDKTKTSNTVLINQVIAIVKSQSKYSEKKGAAPEGVILTVNISAN